MTSTPTRPVDNVVIATKGLQDRNINIIAGTTVENKGKLILKCTRVDFKSRGNVNYKILPREIIFINFLLIIKYIFINYYFRGQN